MTRIIDTKEKVLTGLSKAADVVASTMGAHGKYVLINKNGESRFTKDGVSVAEEIILRDPVENIGAQLVINSAKKTVEDCGDGTTATSVLLRAMANRDIPTNTREYVSKLKEDIETVISKVESSSKELKTLDELESIASTSGNSKEVGQILKTVYEQVGLESRVTLEEDEDSTETYYEVARGVEFIGNTGYISERFKNQRNGYCIFENALVIIDENKSSDHTTYTEAIKAANAMGAPLVIISPNFSNAVISTIAANMSKGLKACLVSAPGWGRNQKENFRDIEALRNEKWLVDKIVITPVAFTIFTESKEGIDERIKEVEDSFDGYIEDHEVRFAEVRINKLRGSTAIIYVGGITEKNRQEEFDRIEDALGAVQTAIEGGYVKGGGIALAEAAKGSQIEDICFSPAFQIKSNAELDQTIEEVNVLTKNPCNLLKEGIIDPTPVVVQSLKNAFASYELLLNTNYILNNESI